MKSNGIKHIVIDIEGTKQVNIPLAVMNSVMEVALDCRNYPLLMHCNHGKVNRDTLNLPYYWLTPTTASNGLCDRYHSQGYGMAH